jgi:hypothetical protein
VVLYVSQLGDITRMPIPTTVFTADEAQALLDFIDKIRPTNRALESLATEEEMAALVKLREAGRFYLPENLKED